MEREQIQEVTQKGVETVQAFFADFIHDESPAALPEVLQNTGVWMSIWMDEVLAIFFLNEDEQVRVNECKGRGVHPFPGFAVGEGQRPAEIRATYNVTSPFRTYLRKRSSETFAFTISQKASCVVMDHAHEIVDQEGNKRTYDVDLAFCLGHTEQGSWEDLEKRLRALLEYARDTWKSTGA
jgi:hypothetical protein